MLFGWLVCLVSLLGWSIACLAVCLSVCLFVHLVGCLVACLLVRLVGCLFVCLIVRFFVCLFVCLFVGWFVCCCCCCCCFCCCCCYCYCCRSLFLGRLPRCWSIAVCVASMIPVFAKNAPTSNNGINFLLLLTMANKKDSFLGQIGKHTKETVIQTSRKPLNADPSASPSPTNRNCTAGSNYI